jgi:hypothetical protein
MALSPCAYALVTVAIFGSLALVVVSLVTERWRSDLTQAGVTEPTFEPSEKQSRVNSDSFCLTRTTPRAGANRPSHNAVDRGVGRLLPIDRKEAWESLA